MTMLMQPTDNEASTVDVPTSPWLGRRIDDRTVVSVEGPPVMATSSFFGGKIVRRSVIRLTLNDGSEMYACPAVVDGEACTYVRPNINSIQPHMYMHAGGNERGRSAMAGTRMIPDEILQMTIGDLLQAARDGMTALDELARMKDRLDDERAARRESDRRLNALRNGLRLAGIKMADD